MGDLAGVLCKLVESEQPQGDVGAGVVVIDDPVDFVVVLDIDVLAGGGDLVEAPVAALGPVAGFANPLGGGGVNVRGRQARGDGQ